MPIKIILLSSVSLLNLIDITLSSIFQTRPITESHLSMSSQYSHQ